MIPAWLTPFANHLWQSTLFAAGIALLAVALRKNRASVRYWLWLTASLKFLLPFSLLVSIGSRFEWQTAEYIAPLQLYGVVDQLAQPFAQPGGGFLPAAPMPASSTDPFPMILLAVWFCGFATVVFCWVCGWVRVRSAVQSASPLSVDVPMGLHPVRVLSSPGLLEPCAIGIFRPVLLIPIGILDRLTPEQLKAIVVHELCHVRRRDNLTAILHMLVECVFWFHPLVWVIGKRLIDERERACDEEVVRIIGQPEIYAQGILNVCRFCLGAPLACAAGVTGSNLTKRIEDIMRNRLTLRLSFSRTLVLIIAAAAAVACPIVIGVVNATTGHAPIELSTSPVAPPAIEEPPPAPVEVAQPQAAPRETFEVASIRPTRFAAGGERGQGGGGSASIRPAGEPCGDHPNSFFLKFDPSRADISDMTAYGLIAWANGLSCMPWKGSFFIVGGPGWMKSDGWDIQAKIPAGAPAFTSTPINVRGAPSERQTMEPRFRKMLQSLLEDRFKLVLRRETRPIPVYTLSVSKSGLKLQTWKEGDPQTFQEWDAKLGLASEAERFREARELGQLDRSWIIGLKTPWKVLVNNLEGGIDRPIVDRTGITTGEFIYRFYYSRLLPPQSKDLPLRPDATTPTAPSLFTALEEELGLKLEAATVPMEVWVVERLERPSEN
jgi:uncharacterized protein (TIGR03435 family)